MKLKEFIRDAHLKPWDGVIILVLILSSFLPIFIFGQTQTADKEAVLRVDGTEIKRFDLVEGQKTYTYLYEDEDGDTIVCLPHKLVIEIQAADGSETDDLIY